MSITRNPCPVLGQDCRVESRNRQLLQPLFDPFGGFGKGRKAVLHFERVGFHGVVSVGLSCHSTGSLAVKRANVHPCIRAVVVDEGLDVPANSLFFRGVNRRDNNVSFLWRSSWLPF